MPSNFNLNKGKKAITKIRAKFNGNWVSNTRLYNSAKDGVAKESFTASRYTAVESHELVESNNTTPAWARKTPLKARDNTQKYYSTSPSHKSGFKGKTTLDDLWD